MIPTEQQRGDLLDHENWNALVRQAARELGGPYQYVDGRSAVSRVRRGSPNEVAYFRVLRVDSNLTVLCNPVTRLTSVINAAFDTAIETRIARPSLLQNIPRTRAGVTYAVTSSVTRVATHSTGTRSERLTPSYETGDLVYAERVGENWTGVPGVEWVDRNLDGRQWADDT